MNQKRWFWIGLWVVLVVVMGFLAFGHGPGGAGYGPWRHGWGRMGNWDDGYRGYREDGRQPPGYNMGFGMGPPYGMMGGYAGMPGMGYGMPLGGLPDLTPEQIKKSGQLQAEALQRNREIMQQMWEAQASLNSLYRAEHRDWNAIREASRKVSELQRRLADASIDLQQQIDGLLTEAQRQEMARTWRGHGWMGAQ